MRISQSLNALTIFLIGIKKNTNIKDINWLLKLWIHMYANYTDH